MSYVLKLQGLIKMNWIFKRWTNSSFTKKELVKVGYMEPWSIGFLTHKKIGLNLELLF